MRAWLLVLGVVPASVASADPTGATGPSGAGEDDDLALIPRTEPPPPEAAPEAGRRLITRLYAEDAMTLAGRRDVAVPFPAPPPYARQNRTSFDATAAWRPTRSLELVVSGRADLIEQDGVALWSRGTLRSELREAYASWEPVARTYLEAGRINVRGGTALGYSPVDWFRPGTLVGQASMDPSVLTRNRLGTLMVRAQTLWDGGSASVLYAPKLFDPPALSAGSIGIDPRLDATGAANRALASVTGSVGPLSAEAMIYLEDRRSKLGLAVTRPIGQSVVAYAEWAAGREADLIARAIDYGRRTQTLPADAQPPIPTRGSLALRNDASAGASWTIATTLTLNLEYHLHQGGLSRADWDRWFSAGRAQPMLAPVLWYIRGYASEQLEPATRHEAFVRVGWPKALVDHLDVSGFAFVNLGDGSTLGQVTASYYVSDRWTLALSLAGTAGSAASERGSLPQAASGILDVLCYL